MTLSREEIELLLKTVSMTRDSELTCDECLKELAEFAESRLEGKSATQVRIAVEQHLAICGECQEEYQALLDALSDEK